MSDKPRLGRIHVLTDEQIQDRFSHVELAALAAAGGAGHVQFREKRAWSTQALLSTALQIRTALDGSSCSLIIDDRADVARAVDAGVHLGRNDLPPEVGRRLLPDQLIGGTANSLEEALAVARTPVDYLGVGPVYGTRTKANPAPVMGLTLLQRIVASVDKPVIAIGSITPERIPEVMATGVHGVALVSAVVCAEDPEAATRIAVAAVEAALESTCR